MANTTGAAAYTQLQKVDNPVGDSMKYWGGILSKRTDTLNQENNKQREAMIKEHQKWAEENNITPEMFKITASTNADYDKQSYAYANVLKQKYVDAYKAADEAKRNGDYKTADDLTQKMKLMQNGFTQVTGMAELIKTEGEKFKEVLQDPSKYDDVLNKNLEDLYQSVYDTKNMVFTLDDNYNTVVAYPSSDGGVKKVSVAAIQTGALNKYVPNVDGAKAVAETVKAFAEDKTVDSKGLFKTTNIQWDESKQKAIEEIMYNRFNDYEMKNLYRKYVDRDYNDQDGFLTDEQKRQVAKAMTKDAEVYYKQEVSKEYDSSAVSLHNNAETLKVRKAELAERAKNNDRNYKLNVRKQEHTEQKDANKKENKLEPTVVAKRYLESNGKKEPIASVGLPDPIKVKIRGGDGNYIEVETRDVIVKKRGVVREFLVQNDVGQYVPINAHGDLIGASGMTEAELNTAINNAFK